MRRTSIDDKEDVKAKLLENRLIIPGQTCWLWTGYKLGNGYGQIRMSGKNYLVHRVSMYVFADNPLHTDNDLHVLHKDGICFFKHCFNPEHLYLGTHEENMKDYSNKVQARPFYPCGHPRIPDNTYVMNKVNICRRCNINAVYRSKDKRDLENNI